MSPNSSDGRDPLELLVVDPESATPPFRQLHDSTVRAIASGDLLPGQKLPTVRALAAHAGIATNTAAAAYRSLEAEGIIEGRGRAGTFVSLGVNPVEAAARRIALDAARQLKGLGLDATRSQAVFAEAVRAVV